MVNPHMWPVCAKIAIVSGGEKEPIQDSTFRAGHEPTQDSTCRAGHEPTQTDTRNRRGGSVPPSSPYDV